MAVGEVELIVIGGCHVFSRDGVPPFVDYLSRHLKLRIAKKIPAHFNADYERSLQLLSESLRSSGSKRFIIVYQLGNVAYSNALYPLVGSLSSNLTSTRSRNPAPADSAPKQRALRNTLFEWCFRVPRLPLSLGRIVVRKRFYKKELDAFAQIVSQFRDRIQTVVCLTPFYQPTISDRVLKWIGARYFCRYFRNKRPYKVVDCYATLRDRQYFQSDEFHLNHVGQKILCLEVERVCQRAGVPRTTQRLQPLVASGRALNTAQV